MCQEVDHVNISLLQIITLTLLKMIRNARNKLKKSQKHHGCLTQSPSTGRESILSSELLANKYIHTFCRSNCTKVNATISNRNRTWLY